VPDFLAPFPVTEIWGLGPATAQKLSERGVHTIAALRAVALEDLGAIVGRGAGAILEYARGADREPLRPKPRARSLSQERTLEEPLVDLRSLGELLELLAERLERALARERRAAQTVTLGVSFVDGSQVTKSRALPVPATGSACSRRPGRSCCRARRPALGGAPPAARAVGLTRPSRPRTRASCASSRPPRHAQIALRRARSASENGRGTTVVTDRSTFDRRKYPRVARSRSCRSRASTRASRSRTRSTCRSAGSVSSASASRSTWARRCACS
jgi:DNA polymerase-4